MEKIKVNVSSSVANILKKDMELFGFFKGEDDINTNKFINTLIANYYDLIEEEKEKLTNDIAIIIKKNGQDENEELSSIIAEYFLEYKFKDELFDTSISFKPTAVSKDAFLNIESSINKIGFSKYFRILFSSYAMKPQYNRERIIFKDKVSLINDAIKNKHALSLKQNDKRVFIFPYKLIFSGEELFNYLICFDESNKPISLRLSNIDGLVYTKKKFDLNADIKNKLDVLIKMGPQYAFDVTGVHEYAVKLTDKGLKMFKKIYIHRPKIDRKEDNILYFKCSYQQIYQYFFRFGKEAYVMYPNLLSKKMRKDYRDAANHYSFEYSLSQNNLIKD